MQNDIAIASTRKNKVGRVLIIVFEHCCKWRYDFIVSKSAIIVYGKNMVENRNNSKYRVFRLGSYQVKERQTYDHI